MIALAPALVQGEPPNTKTEAGTTGSRRKLRKHTKSTSRQCTASTQVHKHTVPRCAAVAPRKRRAAATAAPEHCRAVCIHRNRPRPAQIGQQLAQSRPNSGLGQSWLEVDKVGPMWAHICQSCLGWTKIGPMRASVGPTSIKVAPRSAECGRSWRHRAKLGRVGPSWARCSPNCPLDLAEVGQNMAEIGRMLLWVRFHQHGPTSTPPKLTEAAMWSESNQHSVPAFESPPTPAPCCDADGPGEA